MNQDNISPTKKTRAKASELLTEEERAAMKETVAERRRSAKGANGEDDVLAAIAKMDNVDRPIAEGLHRLIKEVAPDIKCRTWYGFPAYGPGKDVVVFYQFAGKFKARYGTVGFNDSAKLDDGTMWPSAFAITQLNDENERKLRAIIEQALG